MSSFWGPLYVAVSNPREDLKLRSETLSLLAQISTSQDELPKEIADKATSILQNVASKSDNPRLREEAQEFLNPSP